jgi:hypothetical protein
MKKFPTLLKNISFSAKTKIITLGSVLALASTSSHAALPAAVQTAFDSFTALIADYAAPSFALLAAVLVFFIGLKWFRSIASKAT